MIQPSLPYWQGDSWKKALADSIKDPCELFDLLDLPKQHLPAALEVSQQFPLRVTRGFAARMRPGDIEDPLLLQVLPLHWETQHTPGYSTDPVGDLSASQAPGVIHKYHGRVLLVTTGACAVHCRYCFRRHFPYASANPAAGDWQAALQYISNDPSIREVILSGGDPLSLGDDKLRQLLSRLTQIPHVTTVRIHSRLPVVLPERVSEALLTLLSSCGLHVVMVIHANHSNEIDAEVAAALGRMHHSGIVLFNQSVLLRKVNDDAAVLAALSRTLFAHNVMPYYLHTLDAVQGAAHFAVKPERSQAIYVELSRLLPGYLLPRMVTELAGAPFKTPAHALSGPV